MNKIISFCTKNMAVGVILAGVLAVVSPGTFEPLSPYMAWLLGIVMLGMGMSLRPRDFKLVFSQPKNIAVGALLQFVIMPILAYLLIAVFPLPPEIAIGVILVGTCPGGTASNVITYLARGDVALSVSMTMANTILAPLVTPFLIWVLAGTWIQIDFISMMISITQMVLLPLLAGVAVNELFGRHLARINAIMPLVSVAVIILLVGIVVSLSADTLLASGLIVLAVVVLHNLCGLGLGYTFARIFKLNEPQKRAMAIEVGMQNSGLAASLAVIYFTAAGGIPAAIFSVWHNISGSLFASYMAAKDERAKQSEELIEVHSAHK